MSVSLHVEPVAGVVQGRPGAVNRLSALGSTSGQVSDGAVQRHPARRTARRARRLQAGQQNPSTVSLQGTGAGRQHSTVSITSQLDTTHTF